jgi:hypothetical protein
VSFLNGARLTITPDHLNIRYRFGSDLELGCLIVEKEKCGKLCHNHQARIDCSRDEADAIGAFQKAILEASFENLAAVQAMILGIS